MSHSSDIPGPAVGPGAPPPPAAPESRPQDLAARKKELTVRLFACFLMAVERGETFEWRAFRDELESVLWEEALRLAGGNGREAAALVGMPYSTFMNRRRPGRRDEGRPSGNR
jgi:hypothetical protein